ncbi:MAG: hypothetical protein JOZ98_12500 [Solirubrobacterales bacterium]|nr:hypothetical protein [Solirubrobacterales bacterium]
MLEFLIIFAVLAVVVVVVGGPLRAVAADRTSRERTDGAARRNGHAGPAHVQVTGNAEGGGEAPSASEIAELEAARDAKYREIRDAELDHRTGKLSDADYEAIDQTLRAEALTILRALDRASASASAAAAENQRSALP